MKILCIVSMMFVVDLLAGPLGERVAVLENENKALKESNQSLRKDVDKLRSDHIQHEVYIGQDMGHKKEYSSNQRMNKVIAHIVDAILLLLLGRKQIHNYVGKPIVNKFRNGGKDERRQNP